MAPNPVKVQQQAKDISIQIDPAHLKHQSTTTTIPTTGRQDALDSPGPNDVPQSNINLKKEVDRRKSFINWPVPFMSPDKLAEAGFYYLRRGDFVRCVFCEIDIGRWEEGDDPMRDHMRWKPNCPFVKKMDVGNIPLGQEDVRPSTSGSSRSYDTCGPYGVEVRPFSGPENGHNNNPSLENLGIHKSTGPLWKLYGTVEARLRSFALWPVSLKQKPDALTDAGFYYTGKGDQTICFHCGGGLKDWVDSDDPWVQHALWFPKCTYVILRKGKAFIDQVLAENKAKISSKEAMDMEVSTTSEATPPVKVTLEGTSQQEDEPKAGTNNLCKICFTEELGVLFLPCGHIVACVKCAPSLSVCAVCRQPFTATVRAYLP